MSVSLMTRSRFRLFVDVAWVSVYLCFAVTARTSLVRPALQTIAVKNSIARAAILF